MTLSQLILSLQMNGVLRSASIRRALERVRREAFILPEERECAYEDRALPIGEGQTISQPFTVVFMLELLKPEPGDHIVDVGSGSGWQTGLLADIVGTHGRIYGIEVLRALCERGRANIAKFPELRNRIQFFCQNAKTGLPDIAIDIKGFDGIIAAAEVEKVPDAWREQLKTDGRLVYPKSGSIFCERKIKNGTFVADEYPGFVFVPFQEKA